MRRSIEVARLASIRRAAENNHYSPLSQINRGNVKQLATEWTFDTGETGPGDKSH